ncbi:uncharacterized protein LOC144708665 [Wolffia australiana]
MRISQKITTFKPRNTFHFLPFQRFSLPCAIICDQDSSSPDDPIKDSVSRLQTPTIVEDFPMIGRKYSFSRRWYSKDEMIRRVASVLVARGWEWSDILEPKILTDSSRISMVLYELFEETSDAALAFFFFRWSQRRNLSSHEAFTVCTMIQVSVMGNMNHIAMKLLRDLIKCTKVQVHDSLFHLLRESCKDEKIMETVYSMLMSCYLEEESLDVVLELLDSMKALGMFPAAGVCVTLIRRLLNLEKFELAISVFAEAIRHGRSLNVQTMTLFIQHCSSRGNLPYSVNLFLNLKDYDCQPDLFSYTVIIDSLCKKGHLKEAMLLLKRLVEDGLSPDSVLISSVIDGFCKAGRLGEAMDILGIFNTETNEFVFNSLIHRFCIDGNLRDADMLLNVMREMGAVPDFFNWTTLFSGYCRMNKVEQALKVFGGMLKRGIGFSVPTYSILIDCFFKADEVQEAQALLSIMNNTGLKLDVKACNTLIHGYSIRGQMQESLKVLKMMKINAILPDIVTYNILIHGFIRRGFLVEAREVLTELSISGYNPDRFTYTILMNGFIQKGNIQEAYKLWFELGKSGDKADLISCSVILSGLCKMGRVQEAHSLFCKMLEDGLVPDLELCNTLLCGLCREGDVRGAIRFLIIMAENNIIPNFISRRALVNVLKKKSVQDYEEVATIILQQIFGENRIYVESPL